MAQILKDSTQGMIPTNISNEIVGQIIRGSVILQLSKSVDMGGNPEKTFPVLTAGPGAYWVGEGERVQTEAAQWIYPKMVAKKIAVIVPVSKEVLNDTPINVFESLKPYIAESFATLIDKATLFGNSTPFGTGKSIVEVATTKGQVFVEGSIAGQDLAQDISDVMALCENANCDCNGYVSHTGVKNALRKLRTPLGEPIFKDATKDLPAELYGQPLAFSRNGAFDKTKAELICGDWDYAYTGVLQGLEYEILKEATLQNTVGADGKPLSLAEQDMVALKATMRIGFLVVKDNAFSVLKPKTV